MRISITALTFSLFATLFTSAQQKIATETPDYVRYSESPTEADLLETATSRFEKDGHIIDLIAVVHLGDAEYFKALNASLADYDAVLYEMVGGPYTAEKAEQSANAASDDPDLAQVQGLQQMAKNLLGLDYQLDGLNYGSANFIHADISAEEFQRISEEEGGLTTILTRAMKLAQAGKLTGLPTTEAESNQLMMTLVGAVMSGNSNALKRTIAPILAQAESFVTDLESEEETVLIAKRNRVVIDKIEDLKSSRPANAGKKDAVLYGAAHMPDLEKRLLEKGYKKGQTNWATGWTIDKSNAPNADAPSLQEMMEQVGGLMEVFKNAQPLEE